MRATVWAYTWRMLRPYFEGSTGYQLTSGIKVLIFVSLEYHPVYSISLNIKDIDPTYTLGDLARKKAEIIERLKQEGVMDMNKQLVFPLVPQSIAVISSPTAAGFEDFLNSLSANIFNFHFDVSLFTAIMQGEKAEESIIAALEKIYDQEEKFDIVVMIRGGGAQIDLDCFNNYDLAFHITQFPLPVLTGIGHERDETIADMVAHTRLKTPTAVAELLIDRMAEFLGNLEEYEEQLSGIVRLRLLARKEALSKISRDLVINTKHTLFNARKKISSKGYEIGTLINERLNNADNRLEEKRNYLKYRLKYFFQNQQQEIIQLKKGIHRITGYKLNTETEKIQSLEKINELSNPEKVLSRGFSITLHEGKALKDAKKVQSGDELVTVLHKGKIKTKVK
jgi:exodeoxyribonuclease VII large subunit